MYLTYSETLDETVSRLLMGGPKTAGQLFDSIDVKSHNVSIQSLYKSLNRLSSQKVVLKHKKVYRINSEWQESLQEAISSHETLSLRDGDKIRYSFSSFSQVDMFWKNIVASVPTEHLEQSSFYYLPHNFWIHIPERAQSEANYYAHFEKDKKNGYMVIGSETLEDKNNRKKLQNKYLKVNTLNYSNFKNNSHISILGEYITTTTLEMKIARQIDDLYRKYSGKQLYGKLLSIFSRQCAIKIVLERSSSKSNKLRKILSRDFHIPKQV